MVPVAVGMALLAAALFVLLHLQEVRAFLPVAREWSGGLGAWAPFVFALAYAVAVVLFVPGNVMTPLAVALFAPAVAVAAVSVGGTLGATVAFLISRHALRDTLSRTFSRHPRFRRLEEQTLARGPLFVAVARVVPVLPANLLHYAFGLTRVSLGDFVFWSWLCSLPGLTFAVTLLDAALRVIEGRPVPPILVVLMVGLLLIKVLLVTWAARFAREAGVGPVDGGRG